MNLEQNIGKYIERLKYLSLLFSVIEVCIADKSKDSSIAKCSTGLVAERAIEILASGYSLLVVLYYKCSKMYKKMKDSTTGQELKQFRELIRKIKSIIENLETILSKECVFELAKTLLSWRIPELLRATIRSLRVAVERTHIEKTKDWQSISVQMRIKGLLEYAITEIETIGNLNDTSKNHAVCIQLLVALATNVVALNLKSCEEFCTEKIPHAMEILLAKENKPALLFSTIYLCYSELFSKYTTAMVLHLDSLMKNIHSTLKSVTLPTETSQKNSVDSHPNELVIQACLKTLLTLTEVAPKFLDSHLTPIINVLIQLPQLNSNDAATVCKSIGKNVPTKSVLAALMENYENFQRLNNENYLQNFLVILEECCKNASHAYIAANYVAMLDIFLLLMPYSQFFFDINSKDHEKIEEIEEYILSALSAFVIKLNGHQFKDIFLQFSKWASEKVEKKEGIFSFNLRRCLIFVKAATKFAAETLHNFYIPYFSFYHSYLIEMMGELNAIHAIEKENADFSKPTHSLLLKYFTFFCIKILDL